MELKCAFIAFFLVLTFPTSGIAQDESVPAIPPRQNAQEVNLFKTFLAIQMMEIHDRLGLVCGCVETPDPPDALQNQLDSIYAYASEQTDLLIEEAEAAFPGAACPVEIRTFLEARTAGYDSIEEMEIDIASTLGDALNEHTIEAYLLLRRNELYGLSGRKPNLNVLKAEIRALTPICAEHLAALLEYRRAVWRSATAGSTTMASDQTRTVPR